MTKVKTPLLSFDARRKLGDDIVFARRRQVNIVEATPRPYNVRSLAQLSWRHMFQKVVSLWHALSDAEKEAWESLGRRRHMTGYAWFVSQALRPNPGIYLPLQGGKMQGAIDMDGFRIEDLPDPTLAQDPATKAYVDSLSKIVWKDASEQALYLVNQTASVPFTDLDMTAFTSAAAKFAIINLWIHVDSWTSGHIVFSARKNGTTPAARPQVYAVIITGSYTSNVLIIGLDAGQVFEYTLGFGGTAQADFIVDTLGYIE